MILLGDIYLVYQSYISMDNDNALMFAIIEYLTSGFAFVSYSWLTSFYLIDSYYMKSIACQKLF